MGKMYRTSKGQMVDMDALRLTSERSTAVGNMGVNGRGDKLGKGGKTEKTVEQQARAYYRQTPKTSKTVSVTEDITKPKEEVVKEEVIDVEDIKENMPEEKPKKKKKTISKSKEVELEDGSIQIVDEDDEQE